MAELDGNERWGEEGAHGLEKFRVGGRVSGAEKSQDASMDSEMCNRYMLH